MTLALPPVPFRLVDAALTAAAVFFGFELLRFRRRERRSEERFRELANLAHAFAEASEVSVIAACAHEAMARLAPMRNFELYLFDEEDRVREVWATPSEEPNSAPRLVAGHRQTHSLFQREDLDRLAGTETAHSFAPLHLQIPKRSQTKFYLPLFSGSRPVGYWEIEFASPIPRSDIERLRVIYRCLTDAVAAEKNFRLAARDGLSGLFVRRYFDARLQDEVTRSQRYHRTLSVAAFDLDHFKALNDQHGHAAGDEAIRRFAKILQSSLREQDLCGRRGGEEFAAYFPETKAASAGLVCERIRGLLEAEPVVCENLRLPITVSVGVTEFHSGDGLGSILERADSALYRAKDQGRNRVIVAE